MGSLPRWRDSPRISAQGPNARRSSWPCSWAALYQVHAVAELAGEKREIGFGSQIRSYTLHPQQRVKDHRTNTEVGNVEAVLDGDLDRLIRATLLHQSAQRAHAPHASTRT